MISYYNLKNKINNQKNKKYCNTLMLFARRVIYALYYKEDQKIRINVIEYEFKKTIRLINNFRKTSS